MINQAEVGPSQVFETADIDSDVRIRFDVILGRARAGNFDEGIRIDPVVVGSSIID